MSMEGKVVAFTGKLETCTRAEAASKVKGAGGVVSSSVTKKTTHLVAGGDGKVEKAAPGVVIWTEAEFNAALASTSSDDADEKVDPSPAPLIPVTVKSDVTAGEVLEGKVVAFTGKLETFTRAEATAKVKAAGGVVSSGVTKKTTHLVLGSDGKAGKAAEGVIVWTEAQFTAALGSTSSASPASPASPAPVKKEAASSAAGKKRAAPAPTTPQKKPKLETNAEPAKSPARITTRKPDKHLASRDQFTIVDDFTTDMMQTNIGENNNKFYIIQLLQSAPSHYHVFTRWGRLGDVGQQQLADCGDNLEKAITLFEKKFKDKTKNKWGDRHAFVKYDFQYQLVELDASESGEGGGGDAAMGKLSAAQIQKGQAVLEKLTAAIAHDAKAVTALSGEYYSLIPTLSGRQRPPPLNTIELIEEKAALLDFWLRMGFDDMEEQTGLAPIEGIMDLPLPSNLLVASSGITSAAAVKQCQSRGAELVKANAGSPAKPMDKELYGSIVLYTGNWIYAQLNSTLRSENRQAIRKYFNYLRVFLEAMCRMPQKEQTLWRGVSVDLFGAYEEGKVITWWGVSSCTSDENVARNFMQSCGGSCTLLRVKCKTAMDISVLSMYPGEKECLLAPGTQLKVVKRVRNGKIAEIEVEEVGRAI